MKIYISIKKHYLIVISFMPGYTTEFYSTLKHMTDLETEQNFEMYMSINHSANQKQFNF